MKQIKGRSSWRRQSEKRQAAEVSGSAVALDSRSISMYFQLVSG